MMKILSCKYYNKRITTRDNVNVQSHDQEESKLNITIYSNSGAHTLTHDKIIKSQFNKNNVATIKTNSLFHMKITASVGKSSHQDRGPCYLHLPIFFLYIHSPFLLENKSCCDCCFPQQIRPQTSVQ